MPMLKTLSLSNKVLVLAIPLIFLAINPKTYDPFNVTRFFILMLFATIIFFLLITMDNLAYLGSNKVITILAFAFLVQLIIVLFFSQANRQQQLFGVFGRNMGFLSYMALLIFFLACIRGSSISLLNVLGRLLIYLGVLSVIYSVLQLQNLDPFPWVNSHSPIIGFLGNPNFNSAFLGMISGSFLIYLPSKNKKIVLFALIYIFLSLFLIFKSNSIQGFFVFASIFIVLSIIYVFKSQKNRIFRIPIIATSMGLVVFVVLDIFQKLPWGSFFYKPSVTQRGDLWRAAWDMGVNHPLVGVGLDSFMDFHYRSRDTAAASRGWSSELTNDAHNVFLNLFATGGFPLLIVYSLLVIYTFISGIKVIKRTEIIDQKFLAVFLIWIGYCVQSFISINHLGLAIIGWTLSGVIIGYEMISRAKEDSVVTKKPANKKDFQEKFRATVGLFIGFLIGFTPFLNDIKIYNALSTGKITLLQNVVEYWPKNVTYLNIVAEVFEKNNLHNDSLKVAKICVENFPNSAFAWSVIYRSPLVSQSEQDFSKSRILMINPYAKF